MRNVGWPSAAAGLGAVVPRRRRGRRRVVRSPGGPALTQLGSLRGEAVSRDDGGRVRPPRRGGRGAADPARRLHGADEATVVFVHGYALNLDCWHFQRAGTCAASARGALRPALARPLVARSVEHANIDQLGHDLRRCSTSWCRTGRSCWSATRWAA